MAEGQGGPERNDFEGHVVCRLLTDSWVHERRMTERQVRSDVAGKRAEAQCSCSVTAKRAYDRTTCDL